MTSIQTSQANLKSQETQIAPSLLASQFMTELASAREYQRLGTFFVALAQRDFKSAMNNFQKVTNEKEVFKLLCSKEMVAAHGLEYQKDLSLFIKEHLPNMRSSYARIGRRFLRSSNGLNIKHIRTSSGSKISLANSRLNTNQDGNEYFKAAYQEDRRVQGSLLIRTPSLEQADNYIRRIAERYRSNRSQSTAVSELVVELKAGILRERLCSELKQHCENVGSDTPAWLANQNTVEVSPLNFSALKKTKLTESPAKPRCTTNHGIVSEDIKNRTLIITFDGREYVTPSFDIKPVIYNTNNDVDIIGKVNGVWRRFVVNASGFEDVSASVVVLNKNKDIKANYYTKPYIITFDENGSPSALYFNQGGKFELVESATENLFSKIPKSLGLENSRYSWMVDRESNFILYGDVVKDGKEKTIIIKLAQSKVESNDWDCKHVVVDFKLKDSLQVKDQSYLIFHGPQEAGNLLAHIDKNLNVTFYQSQDLHVLKLLSCSTSVYAVCEDQQTKQTFLAEVKDINNIKKCTDALPQDLDVDNIFTYRSSVYFVGHDKTNDRKQIFSLGLVAESESFSDIVIHKFGDNISLRVQDGYDTFLYENHSSLDPATDLRYRKAHEALSKLDEQSLVRYTSTYLGGLASQFKSDSILTRVLDLKDPRLTSELAVPYSRHAGFNMLLSQITATSSGPLSSLRELAQSLGTLIRPEQKLSKVSRSEALVTFGGDPLDKHAKKEMVARVSPWYIGFLASELYGSYEPANVAWQRRIDKKEAHGTSIGSIKIRTYSEGFFEAIAPINSKIIAVKNSDGRDVSRPEREIDSNTEVGYGQLKYKVRLFMTPSPSNLSRADYLRWRAGIDPGKYQSIAKLPDDAKEFCDSIRLQSPAYQLQAVATWVKRHGFYDYENRDVREAKFGQSLEKKFEIMQKRQEEIALENVFIPNIDQKKYAGVCVDFAELAVSMYRDLGLVSGLAVGYKSLLGKVTVANAHAIAYVEIPDSNGIPVLHQAEVTPDSSVERLLLKASRFFTPNTNFNIPPLEFPEFNVPQSNYLIDSTLLFNAMKIPGGDYHLIRDALEQYAYGGVLTEVEAQKKEVPDVPGNELRALLRFYSGEYNGKPRMSQQEISNILGKLKSNLYGHVYYAAKRMLESDHLQDL